MATTGPKIASDASENANARDQLIDAASQIMRDGDTIDLSLSELSLRAGLNSALVKYYLRVIHRSSSQFNWLRSSIMFPTVATGCMKPNMTVTGR